MQDYINGCYTKNGTRDMTESEIKLRRDLGGGYSCAIGQMEDDGIAVDILKDGEVIAWEHGIESLVDFAVIPDCSIFVPFAVNRLREMGLL